MSNYPFPSLYNLHCAIIDMGRLAAGRDGGPSIEVHPDSIHRSVLLIEDMIGALVPTRVEDQPISGRVMLRWVRAWGELLLEIPPNCDYYVYHLYYNGELGKSGMISTVTALYNTLWEFLQGPQ